MSGIQSTPLSPYLHVLSWLHPRLELGFLRLLGNSHFPAGYMGFLSKTPQIVYGIPSFPGFKPPSLEGKNPNSPQLWQLLIQGKCL